MIVTSLIYANNQFTMVNIECTINKYESFAAGLRL
jgi:hypothetical protein